MAKKPPATRAVLLLRQHNVEYQDHCYRYRPGGGTGQFAREFQVDEHRVIKTLIMEDERKQPLIVLMHGDREVSTRALARHIGCKSVTPCEPATANRHSGYQVGGTSPFGTRRSMPVYCERSILALPKLYINGGGRGYLISLSARDLERVLQPQPVEVQRPR